MSGLLDQWRKAKEKIEQDWAARMAAQATTAAEIQKLVNKERAHSKALLKAYLKECGIQMKVQGCGCCGSPIVTFEFLGVRIVDEQENFSFDMFNEEDED